MMKLQQMNHLQLWCNYHIKIENHAKQRITQKKLYSSGVMSRITWQKTINEVKQAGTIIRENSNNFNTIGATNLVTWSENAQETDKWLKH